MKNHLFKYKWLYLVFILAIIGFVKVNTSGQLNYNDMLDKPKATFQNNSVSVFLGHASSPIWWVNPQVKITNQKIFISASWSLLEHPNTLLVKLPDPSKTYKVFWVDNDGKITKI